jgi:hypothetical protein
MMAEMITLLDFGTQLSQQPNPKPEAFSRGMVSLLSHDFLFLAPRTMSCLLLKSKLWLLTQTFFTE